MLLCSTHGSRSHGCPRAGPCRPLWFVHVSFDSAAQCQRHYPWHGRATARALAAAGLNVRTSRYTVSQQRLLLLPQALSTCFYMPQFQCVVHAPCLPLLCTKKPCCKRGVAERAVHELLTCTRGLQHAPGFPQKAHWLAQLTGSRQRSAQSPLLRPGSPTHPQTPPPQMPAAPRGPC